MSQEITTKEQVTKELVRAIYFHSFRSLGTTRSLSKEIIQNNVQKSVRSFLKALPTDKIGSFKTTGFLQFILSDLEKRSPEFGDLEIYLLNAATVFESYTQSEHFDSSPNCGNEDT